jgi:hypothetical protein
MHGDTAYKANASIYVRPLEGPQCRWRLSRSSFCLGRRKKAQGSTRRAAVATEGKENCLIQQLYAEG